MTAWQVTFEVDVPNGVARDDAEAIGAAIARIDARDFDDIVITAEPVNPPPPPSRFGPASRSQDERRP